MTKPLLLIALLLATLPASADEGRLLQLNTADSGRGWDAVGRLNFGNYGFCTGALIAPDLVLTAGHCLFDKQTGARIDTAEMHFLAGWRNGRAAAYRGVAAAVAHSAYVYDGDRVEDRVRFDLALLKLDQPILLPSVLPFETGAWPARGDHVGVVSYAQDRSEAPSLQKVCEVLAQRADMLMLSCDVDFGSSGAPVFSLAGGVARVISVVSAKAEVEGRKVALGTSLEGPLAELKQELLLSDRGGRATGARVLRGGGARGAKFVRPDEGRSSDDRPTE